MLKVQPSTIGQKEIKKKKKVLEKADLFEFALQYNGKTYLHINYSRFGNTTGILILSENGESVAREEALKPTILFNHYNTYIHAVINVMIPETKKSLKPYEEVVFHLDKEMDSATPEYVMATKDRFERIIQTRKAQEEIVYKIRDIQNRILDEKGYLTESDLTKIREYTESFNRGQFIFAIEQLENVEEVKKTIVWLEESNNLKAISLLKEHVSERSMDILKKAHLKQTADFHGNEVAYPPGEKGTDKWIEVYRDIVEQSTEKNIIPLLRN